MTTGLALDIDISGLNDVIADVDTYPQDVGRELTLAMELSLRGLKLEVKRRAPENVGTLRESFNHQIISPFPNLVGIVGTPKFYGLVMEVGRKAQGKAPPGELPDKMPPVDAIRLWVVRKLGKSGKEADSAAFAIARSIAEKGIKGRYYLRESLKVSEPAINKLFDAAIARSVQRFNQS